MHTSTFLTLATLSGPALATYTTEYLTGSSNNTIQVLVEGSGPAVVIAPSYARDSIDDFNDFSTALAASGYRVVRPQPRGMAESTGPIDTTRAELEADWVSVIDTYANGKAVVLGHAAGKSNAMQLAAVYPERVPAIVLAAISVDPNATVKATADIASNYSYSATERLAALELGYFASGNNASLWLTGWHLDAMGTTSGNASVANTTSAIGNDNTQILDIIPKLDPWRSQAQWNYTVALVGDRSTPVFVEDASHALFPENLQGVLDVLLPWLEVQTAEW